MRLGAVCHLHPFGSVVFVYVVSVKLILVTGTVICPVIAEKVRGGSFFGYIYGIIVRIIFIGVVIRKISDLFTVLINDFLLHIDGFDHHKVHGNVQIGVHSAPLQIEGLNMVFHVRLGIPGLSRALKYLRKVHIAAGKKSKIPVCVIVVRVFAVSCLVSVVSAYLLNSGHDRRACVVSVVYRGLAHGNSSVFEVDLSRNRLMNTAYVKDKYSVDEYPHVVISGEFKSHIFPVKLPGLIHSEVGVHGHAEVMVVISSIRPHICTGYFCFTRIRIREREETYRTAGLLSRAVVRITECKLFS